MSDRQPVAPVQIDVGHLARRSVATLYSHLVTRPTGRAVRLAIETQLAEVETTSCSTIDLTEVTVLDFSCADEVVAKLVARYLREDRPRDAFFVFRGVGELHRDPVEAVLERHGLAAVAEVRERYELLGVSSPDEHEAWNKVERLGRVDAAAFPDTFSEGERRSIDRLVGRRVVFRAPGGGIVALSRLAAS